MPTIPQLSAPLSNPAEQLGTIVSQLYELAGNSQVSQVQRQALFLQAHDLRGDLMGLVTMQFSQATSAYTSTMNAITAVTNAINQAEQNIQSIVNVVNGASQLATSIDLLLQEVAKVATSVAAA